MQVITTGDQRQKQNLVREYTEPRELYSAAGVGYLLDLSARTIKDWAKNGKFPKPFIDFDRFVRWTRKQVLDWIESKGKEAG